MQAQLICQFRHSLQEQSKCFVLQRAKYLGQGHQGALKEIEQQPKVRGPERWSCPNVTFSAQVQVNPQKIVLPFWQNNSQKLLDTNTSALRDLQCLLHTSDNLVSKNIRISITVKPDFPYLDYPDFFIIETFFLVPLSTNIYVHIFDYMYARLSVLLSPFPTSPNDQGPTVSKSGLFRVLNLSKERHNQRESRSYLQ